MNESSTRKRRLVIAVLMLITVLYPVVYLSILNMVVPNRDVSFHVGWEDTSFQGQWKLAYNRTVDATMSSEGGVLKLYAFWSIPVDSVIMAQRTEGLEFDLFTYKYLKVSTMTSDIDAAAKIVVWTDQNHSYTVLLKTFGNKAWHTEIVDLLALGVDSSHLSMIELGWSQILAGQNEFVYYSNLSFNTLEVA